MFVILLNTSQLILVLFKFVSLYFIPEEIGINSPDEREVILSEIYRRFHPEEEDLFEMEIQGEINIVFQGCRLGLLQANFNG